MKQRQRGRGEEFVRRCIGRCKSIPSVVMQIEIVQPRTEKEFVQWCRRNKNAECENKTTRSGSEEEDDASKRNNDKEEEENSPFDG
ncbi:hypothetical protein L195_g038195 [Trifolium pratense]|uniref:Uncharacterized protein n=1 Tax=Trifolium pratense TaxID=57577 RepID=A0A2K3LUG2_TRIPR|nr:hypothetical protein L195_g038195 [Trifolium pratense]